MIRLIRTKGKQQKKQKVDLKIFVAKVQKLTLPVLIDVVKFT